MNTTVAGALRRFAVVTSVLSMLGATVAVAAPGGLDSTFSGDGKQTTDFPTNWNDAIFDMALQSDGMIVAVGEHLDPADWNASTHDFALARYNTDGSPDHLFSGDGLLVTDFGGYETARGVTIQSNGMIVVTGNTCSPTCDAAFARYKDNGDPDPLFDGDGKAVLDFGDGNNFAAKGVRVRADGKIVAVGSMTNGSGNSDFAAYRLNPDGSPNGEFSGDGRASFGFGAGLQDDANDMVLAGKKILMVGSTCNSSYTTCDFAVARLTANGTLDKTFSGDGKTTADFGGEDRAWGAALQPDGKIVVVGYKHSGLKYYMAVARYNTNGSLDKTFNGTGKKLISMGTRTTGADVLVLGNGKIVVAGTGDNGSNFDFAIVRLKPDGHFDGTFSGDGRRLIDFGQYDVPQALVRQKDGKYVLGGLTFVPSPNDFALARVLP